MCPVSASHAGLLLLLELGLLGLLLELLLLELLELGLLLGGF